MQASRNTAATAPRAAAGGAVPWVPFARAAGKGTAPDLLFGGPVTGRVHQR
ncbi:hypothetical protein [Streptomyces sp. TS71-3]|uniref:hypothetical protein n=1 Tax=Streptomyces sp. TS71-3 TaxID=2733862 RepID=UPI001AFE5446|nr:hypothetical protein [Streptomyces sp. TS71-3]GHJ37027.1 hypothetical protein Sm713_26360 [Streptomyces sp. TS71-3]